MDIMPPLESRNSAERALFDYVALLVQAIRQFGTYRPSLAYQGSAEFLIRHGVFMDTVPVLPKGIRRGTPRQCFENASRRASSAAGRRAGLVYAEGVAAAVGGILPVAHAWLMDRDGRAVEVTWAEPGTAYLGAPFDAGYARERRRREEACLDDFNSHFALFRGLVKPEQWRLSGHTYPDRKIFQKTV